MTSPGDSGSKPFSAADVFLLVTVALLAILYYVLRKKDQNSKLPPGPYCLPVVGYIPFLTFKPYKKLNELSKKYGPIFSLRLGNKYTVVLSDYESIKEAFAKDVFIGRPPESPFELSEETIKTGAINGIAWKEQRRFSLQMFRDLGMGKSVMEQHVREEICELIDRMKNEIGDQGVDVSKMLQPSMSNNIASLVFGNRRRFDDPKRIQLDRDLRNIGRLAGLTAWLIFFPWMKPIVRAFGFSKQEDLSNALKSNKNYISDEISEHQKNLDKNNVKDFIDGYLLEIEKKSSISDTTFKLPILKDLVGAFFGAGSETVRTSVDWLLLICAAYQDVQAKVHAEIDTVFGTERFPSKEDQKMMPYTSAVIMEMMRWITIIPINLFRYSLQDAQLCGYFIPKHSYISANLWAIHHDPKIWGDDAELFKPERFLSPDGKEVRKSDYLIPFSIGKRACPGESLANMEVFLYFTSLLQKFHFSLPEGSQPDFEGQLGIGLSPKPYKLIYKLR